MPENKPQGHSTRTGSKDGHRPGSVSSSKPSGGNNAATKPGEQKKEKGTERVRTENGVTANKNTNDNGSDTDSSGYPTDYRDPDYGHSRTNHAKSISKNVKYSPANFDTLYRELEASRICMENIFADPERAAEKRSSEASWLQRWGDQFMESQHNFMNELASTPPEHIPHIFKELHHNIFRTLPHKLRGGRFEVFWKTKYKNMTTKDIFFWQLEHLGDEKTHDHTHSPEKWIELLKEYISILERMHISQGIAQGRKTVARIEEYDSIVSKHGVRSGSPWFYYRGL